MWGDKVRKAGGLYKIHLSDTHYYVGRAKSLDRRRKEHQRLLRQGLHVNPHMQRVYDQFKVYRFEVLEMESDDNMRALKEQVLLDEHFGQTGCVNISRLSVGGDHGLWSEAQSLRLAEANRRRVWTPEQRAKIADANKKREITCVTRNKLRANYVGSRGKTFSAESRARMQEAQCKRRTRERAEREEP